jgi:hypothetical protein
MPDGDHRPNRNNEIPALGDARIGSTEPDCCSTMQAPSIDDALALVAKGYWVIPLRKNEKKPAISRWPMLAASDEPSLRRIWKLNANIGIACGPSDIVVLDVDPRNGGDESFARVVCDVGTDHFEAIPCVKTPGGGRHYYFRQPEVRVRNDTDLLPGIDLRGDGDYAVAPPSFFAGDATHDYQGYYSWLIADGIARPFPVELLEYARPKRGAVSKIAAVAKAAKVIRLHPNEPWLEGSRNVWLTRQAGWMRNEGVTDDVLRETLRNVNNGMCRPPLPGSEVDAIAGSAVRGFERRFDDRVAFIWEWQRRGVRRSALDLLVALARGADGDGIWAPNRAQLMRAANFPIHSINTFNDAVHRLIDAGAIETTIRGSDLSTIYRLKCSSTGSLREAA